MTVSRIARYLAIMVALVVVGCGTTVDRATSTPSASPIAVTTPATSPSVAPAPASPTPTASPSPPAGDWLPAGELRDARGLTHVALLGTGEILVVGSDNVCNPATAGSDSVEIGDPKAGSWELTTKLVSPRERPTLVALQDGRALLTGGETGEDGGPSAYSSTYVFDPADRKWSRSGLLHTARRDPAAAVLADGRVLVAGGMYNDRTQNPRVLDSTELWDPKSGAWSVTGRLADARMGASAVTLADGRVLVVGGLPKSDSDLPRSSAEIYDPATSKWTAAGTLATARRGYSLVALADGGALVAGGLGVGLPGPFLSSVERFDPASKSWSSAPDLKVATAGATGIRLADGRVLLAGGATHEPTDVDSTTGTYVSGFTADAELFDPTTGGWSATAAMPKPREGASAVLLADGSVVVVGGLQSEGDIESTPCTPDPAGTVFRYVPGG